MGTSKSTAKVLVISPESPNFELAEHVPYSLAALSHYLTDIKSRAIARFEITLPEWKVLICLIRHESCSLNDIVHYSGLKQSSLSRIVVRMARKDLLRHSKRKTDCRYREIRITEYGRQICSDASTAVQAQCDRFLRRLNATERQVFVNAIKKLLSSIPDAERPAGFSQLNRR